MSAKRQVCLNGMRNREREGERESESAVSDRVDKNGRGIL